jgi:hypothetical protein
MASRTSCASHAAEVHRELLTFLRELAQVTQ